MNSLCSQRGSVTFIALLLIPIAILLFLFLLHSAVLAHNRLKSRTQTYLCLKEVIRNTQKYTKEISKYNKLLLVTYPLQYVPKTAVVAKALVKLYKLKQELLFLSHVKKSASSSFCKDEKKTIYLKTQPYSRSILKFSRGPMDITNLKKGYNKWTIYLPDRTNLILLEAHLKLNSPYQTMEVSSHSVRDLGQFREMPFLSSFFSAQF